MRCWRTRCAFYLLEPLDGFVVMTQTPSWIDVLIVVVAAVVVAMAIGALAALYPGWTVARLMLLRRLLKSRGLTMEKMQAKQPQTYDRPIFGSKPAKKGRSSGRQAQRSVGAESTPGSSGHAGSTPLVMPKRRMSLNAKMFLFILVIFAGIATAGTLLLRQPEDRFVLDTYQYVTVGMRDFCNVVSGSGRVTPTAVTVLAAPTDVRVRAVYVPPGDDVEHRGPFGGTRIGYAADRIR